MATTGRRHKMMGMGCLVLFALPFAGVGVFMAGLMVRHLATWQAMQSWVEVPASILTAKLEGHETHRVTARYEYEFGGRRYESTRVAISSQSDNLGKFHERAAAELKSHVNSGKPFRCFANPQNPSDAILYRDLRVELVLFILVFVLVFGGVGFGLIVVAVIGYRKQRAQADLARTHAGEPWKWKSEWASGKIRSSQSGFVYLLVFAVFWNLVSWPGVLFGWDEITSQGFGLVLLASLFPTVGVGLIIAAIYGWLRQRKFGVSVFEMATLPGVVGGPLAGVIQVPRKLHPHDGFQLTLSCIHTYRSGDDTKQETLWQDDRRLAREMFDSGSATTAIPVQFAIPYHVRATEEGGSSGTINWRLEVRADDPGVDYQATFEVPVFRTKDSSPDFRLDESLLKPFLPDRSVADLMREAKIRLEPLPGNGSRFHFPPARALGAAIGMTVFLAIWTSFIVVMVQLAAPIIFPIVFGLFAVLILAFCLHLWLAQNTIDIEYDEVVLRGGWVGLGRSRRIPRQNVKSIEVRQSMQSGTRTWYNLRLRTYDGHNYTIGRHIRGRSLAQAVADTILQTICGDHPNHSE